MTAPTNSPEPERIDYSSPLFGYWTPEAFDRDNGAFAQKHELFVVSAKTLDKYIGLIVEAVKKEEPHE